MKFALCSFFTAGLSLGGYLILNTNILFDFIINMLHFSLPKPNNRSENSNKEISSYLEHLRLIHFSLTTIAATILYLVATSWNPGNEIQHETAKFSQLIQSFQGTNFGPAALLNTFETNFDSSIKQFALSVGKGSWRIGSHSIYDKSNLVIKIYGRPIAASKTFGEYRTNFETTTWDVEFANQIVSENPIEFAQSQEKLTFGSVVAIETQFFVTNNNNYGLNREKGKYRFFEMKTYSGALDFAMPISVFFTNNWVNAIFSATNIHCQFSQKWFAGTYPALDSAWKELKDIPTTDFNEHLEEMKIRALRGQSLKLLGLEMKAEHVGWVGPILLFVVLLYLRAYILELRLSLKTNEHFVIPWIGMMSSPCALFVSIATIILLPSVAIWLAILRLLGSPFWASATGLIFFLVAVSTWILIPVLRHKRIQKLLDLICALRR